MDITDRARVRAWTTRIAIAIVAVAAAIWAAGSLAWPFGYDQGAISRSADVLLRGGIPFRDAFDVKGPASFLPSAAALALFGRNWWGLRLLDLVAVGWIALAIGRLGSRFAGRACGIAAALLWVLAYGNTGAGNTAQPDLWVSWLLLATGTSICLSDEPPASWRLALLAAAVGVATLVKPFYAAFLILPAGAVLLDRPAGRRRGALGLVTVGFVVPVLLAGVWYGMHGGLGALWEAYVSFNVSKNSPDLIGVAVSAISYGLVLDPVVLIAFPLAVAGAVALYRVSPRAALVLGGWFVLALLCILIQRPYFPYRLHTISPVMAVLAAVAVARLRGNARNDPGGTAVPDTLGAVLFLLAAVTLGRHPLGEGLRGIKVLAGVTPRAEYYGQFRIWHHASASDAMAVTRFLADSTPPGTAVFAWDWPSVAVLADRPTTPRLIVSVVTNDAVPEAVRQHYLDELARDLRAAAPPVVVAEDTLGLGGRCLACLPPFAAMGRSASALTAGYHPVFRSGPLIVFRR